MIILGPFPPLKISRERLKILIAAVISNWPTSITFCDKEFGPGSSYTCRSILKINDQIVNEFQSEFHADLEDIFGIVIDMVGKAMKHSSYYLYKVDRSFIDVDVIADEILARDDFIKA